MRIPHTPEGVLGFWLGPLRDVGAASEHGWRERMLRWRVGVFARAFEDPEFSDAQREFYEALHELGESRVFAPSAGWDTPHGQLAKLIVLDQFPRCVYRGTPLAYENDAQTVPMLKHIFEQGWDTREYNVMERLWAYIALSHPENRELQELSVLKWTQWSADLIAAAPREHRRVNQRVGWNFVKAVIEHSEAVLLHGKFPHRNPILCRPHRAGEVHYLTSEMRPPWSFTQPPRADYYALHAALHASDKWADCRAIDRELLGKLHDKLGLSRTDPGATLMDVFDVLGRDTVAFREVYRHARLRRNEALQHALTRGPLVPYLAKIQKAIFKEAPQQEGAQSARLRVPKVIDVPALNLAIGCPMLDRGEVTAPRSAIDNFMRKTGFAPRPFGELFERYQEAIAEAHATYEATQDGMRRRAPVERRAFDHIASGLFAPSPAREGVLGTLYELLDLDYDGTVDAGEMLVALVALCSGSVEDKLRVCFRVFDADGSGKLDAAELADLVHTTLLRGLHVVEALCRNYLPEGQRESTELVTLFSLANFSLIEQVAERALSDADKNGDGQLDEEEFVAWGKAHPLFKQLLTLSEQMFWE
jgi:uncharacterized protein (DUF924 family)/Ca2+-binding EF-hand superfamily protein